MHWVHISGLSGTAFSPANDHFTDLMGKSFYFALPLDENAHKFLYSLDSYVSKIETSEAQIVDFDCAIIVLPTSNQLGHLKDVLKDDFEETSRPVTFRLIFCLTIK